VPGAGPVGFAPVRPLYPTPDLSPVSPPPPFQVGDPAGRPVSAAPSRPVSSAPAGHPVSAAPSRPVSSAPSRPVSSAPAGHPVSAAPSRPVSSAPSRPVSSAPAGHPVPESAAPSLSPLAVPGQPAAAPPPAGSSPFGPPPVRDTGGQHSRHRRDDTSYDLPRVDPGRHSEPHYTDQRYPDQGPPDPRRADRHTDPRHADRYVDPRGADLRGADPRHAGPLAPQGFMPAAPAPPSHRHGAEQPEQSPWAPPTPPRPTSLPPGYERIPTARTAPPPQYDEAPAVFQEPPSPSPSRPYVRSIEHAGDMPPRGASPARGEAFPSGGTGRTAAPAREAPGGYASGENPIRRAPDAPRSSGPRRAWDTAPEHLRSSPDDVDAAGGWPGAPRWGEPDRPAEPPRVLPQRVPAEPDVPDVPEAGPEEAGPDASPAAAPELARIATYLRDEDEDDASFRPDGFDIPAVLAAVRVFPGVREAHVRTNETGAHTLRLELADDADPGEVSREVARLLKERMGLAAEPNEELFAPAPVVPRRRRAAPEEAPPPRYEHHEAAARTEAPAAAPPSGPPAAPSNRPPAAPPSRPSTVPPAAPPSRPPAAPPSGPPSSPRGTTSGPPTPARPAELRPGVGRPADTRQPAAARPQPADAGWAAATRAYPHLTEQGRDTVPAHRPLPGAPGVPRVVLDHVEVGMHGTDAVVEVRLTADECPAVGVASGPAFDGYVLRLAALAAANAIDELLAGAARCFIEQATVVPLGSCEVAVVVLLLAHGGWVEELSGSAVVNGDQRHAVVRATLAAVNRRLEALLP
jgi:hypothetical protein